MSTEEKEQTAFEKYILFGTQEGISLAGCIKNEVLIILFSLPVLIFKRTNYIFFLLELLPAICYLISIIRLTKEGKIQGADYILQNGIFSICMSFSFGLSGLAVLLYAFSGGMRIFLLCIAAVGYAAALLIYGGIMRQMMERKDLDNVKKVNGGFLFLACGVLGVSAARIFLRNISNEMALGIMCICCFFLSFIALLGAFNLVKYHYLIKHKELLGQCGKA